MKELVCLVGVMTQSNQRLVKQQMTVLQVGESPSHQCLQQVKHSSTGKSLSFTCLATFKARLKTHFFRTVLAAEFNVCVFLSIFYLTYLYIYYTYIHLFILNNWCYYIFIFYNCLYMLLVYIYIYILFSGVYFRILVYVKRHEQFKIGCGIILNKIYYYY